MSKRFQESCFHIRETDKYTTTPGPRPPEILSLAKFLYESLIQKHDTAAMNAAPTEICKNQDEDDGDSLRNDQPRDLCNELVLIPGLPNHLAQLCLSSLHPFLLYSVCHSWRHFIYSPACPPFFSLYALLRPISSIDYSSDSVELFSFDPISATWKSLPNPPSNPPLRLLHRHPSFISRILPIQSLTVSGRLLLIAATTHNFLPALQRPLGFDPSTKKWFFGPPLQTPRRWCVTGSADGAVYVASGVGSGYKSDVARSVEKWNIKNAEIRWNWEKIATYKDGRFSREATEAVGYKGKLCMVNVNGNAVKDGAVYNVISNQWEEMPEGMLAGWQGPAAMDHEEEVIYVVDEANGALSKYNPDRDQWEEVIKSPEHLKGAVQIAAGRGRVCAVCAGVPRISVVDVAKNPARIWAVNSPPEMEVIAVHILPRMTCSDD